MTRRPVHVDTDVGGDFDDANALAFLLGSDDVDLVAVTTVGAGGDAVRRAKVARYVLDAGGGRGVPVSAGFDQPLLPNRVLAGLSGRWVLNGYDDSMAPLALDEAHAVDAILRSVSKHGEDLTLLCIGCLTNVAVAIRRDPATMSRLGSLVLMGGAFVEQAREANIALDPEAADIVFRAGLPVRAVGVELARRATVPVDVHERSPVASTELGLRLATLARRYGDAYDTDTITLYDVTAAAAVTDPELLTFEQARVAVELDGRHTRGMTIVERDPYFNVVEGGSIISIATDVRTDEVLERFERRVIGGMRSPADDRMRDG